MRSNDRPTRPACYIPRPPVWRSLNKRSHIHHIASPAALRPRPHASMQACSALRLFVHAAPQIDCFPTPQAFSSTGRAAPPSDPHPRSPAAVVGPCERPRPQILDPLHRRLRDRDRHRTHARRRPRRRLVARRDPRAARRGAERRALLAPCRQRHARCVPARPAAETVDVAPDQSPPRPARHRLCRTPARLRRLRPRRPRHLHVPAPTRLALERRATPVPGHPHRHRPYPPLRRGRGQTPRPDRSAACP